MDYLSLCLICKDENDYLPEWLNYHILMGVDRFYIYDNDSQVSLRHTLKEYIERGWVVVVNIAGKAMQLYAYDHCLQVFGKNTFWMGFIDTDEFLVPKTTRDLKMFLKDYESFGGLAVSSLFFGSNNHSTRPLIGQIAAYTRRTHTLFSENELIKSIVQPRFVQMPNSPHDFIMKEGSWYVNEDNLRVDYQRFPNYTNKIQLNHYYCRSEFEINLKLRRGRGDDTSAWARKRFDSVNQLAGYEDHCILDNLEGLFLDDRLKDVTRPGSPLERMAILAGAQSTSPLEIAESDLTAENFRTEFARWMEFKADGQAALERGDIKQVCQVMLGMIELQPQCVNLYQDIAINFLNIKDPESAWRALSLAWQISPNNFIVLRGMAYYFLKVENFVMAENTCRLLMEISPHDMVTLGMLTYSLIGQTRWDEAVTIGVPVIELSAQIGELPDQMGVFLVKKLADHLLQTNDFEGAVHLWKVGVKCQTGDVRALLELHNALLLAGRKTEARQCMLEARKLAPEHPAVLAAGKKTGDSRSRWVKNGK